MFKKGEVIFSSEDELTIKISRSTDCDKCHACYLGDKSYQIKCSGYAEVGERVTVHVPDSSLLKAAAVAYMIPLLGLLGGTAIGYFLYSDDVFTLAGGVLGLFVSYFVIHLINKSIDKKAVWKPTVVRATDDGFF